MIDTIKEYANKRLELLRLEATEKYSLTIGVIFFISFVLIIGIFFILLLNISLGLLIGFFIGNYAYGLLIMSAFYFATLILLFVFRKSIITGIANKYIKYTNE